jgi:hypothetical protein
VPARVKGCCLPVGIRWVNIFGASYGAGISKSSASHLSWLRSSAAHLRLTASRRIQYVRMFRQPVTGLTQSGASSSGPISGNLRRSSGSPSYPTCAAMDVLPVDPSTVNAT